MTIAVFAALTLIAACIMSLCLYLYLRRKIGPGAAGRRKVLVLTGAAPFVGVCWLVLALVLHVEISNRFAHQDCGLSGDPYVTLPNGYELGSHNTYDGYFKAPGYQTDVPLAGPGYVRSLVDLQFSDPYFTGTQWDFKTETIRKFTFDTRTRIYEFSDSGVHATFEEVATRAQQDPTSYWRLYDQYRHHWPNYVLLALIVAGESTICLAVRKLWNATLSQPREATAAGP